MFVEVLLSERNPQNLNVELGRFGGDGWRGGVSDDGDCVSSVHKAIQDGFHVEPVAELAGPNQDLSSIATCG